MAVKESDQCPNDQPPISQLSLYNAIRKCARNAIKRKRVMPYFVQSLERINLGGWSRKNIDQIGESSKEKGSDDYDGDIEDVPEKDHSDQEDTGDELMAKYHHAELDMFVLYPKFISLTRYVEIFDKNIKELEEKADDEGKETRELLEGWRRRREEVTEEEEKFLKRFTDALYDRWIHKTRAEAEVERLKKLYYGRIEMMSQSEENTNPVESTEVDQEKEAVVYDGDQENGKGVLDQSSDGGNGSRELKIADISMKERSGHGHVSSKTEEWDQENAGRNDLSQSDGKTNFEESTKIDIQEKESGDYDGDQLKNADNSLQEGSGHGHFPSSVEECDQEMQKLVIGSEQNLKNIEAEMNWTGKSERDR